MLARAAASLLRLIDGAFTAMVVIAGSIAAVMMLATFANVVMRYIFRSPISGVFELTEIGMGLVVFFALPGMIRRRGNIAVTVLFDRFPAALRHAATVVTDALGAGLCAFIAWRMWLQGERMMRVGEVSMELRIPKGLVAQSMSALMAAAALAFAICALEALRGRVGGAGGGGPMGSVR